MLPDCRELDDAPGLTETANECLQESRGGRNVRRRLEGYEDTNDAERLADDPPKRPVILYDDSWNRAESGDRARRVAAKVAWHSRELFPRVGFIVTTMAAGPEVVFDSTLVAGQPSS